MDGFSSKVHRLSSAIQISGQKTPGWNANRPAKNVIGQSVVYGNTVERCVCFPTRELCVCVYPFHVLMIVCHMRRMSTEGYAESSLPFRGASVSFQVAWAAYYPLSLLTHTQIFYLPPPCYC
mmetsp:Transcript_32986/g.71270  ORF Transcript_32986/g.71270 Transcript_32986/m.71270 type:complete len:122 (+) Transcript_32986:2232-2597(+)